MFGRVLTALTMLTIAGCAGGERGAWAFGKQTIPPGVRAVATSDPQGNPVLAPLWPPFARPPQMAPAARAQTTPLMYVGAWSYPAQVLIYNLTPNSSPVGSITAGVSNPWGLWVDRFKNLYVCNEHENTVTEYAAGGTIPIKTWSADLASPLYPMVDHDGDLFVGNQGNGTVVEFKSGSTNPYRILRTPGIETDGMDIGPLGNLYVAYRSGDSPGQGDIATFPPNSTRGVILGMSLNEPQGLIVDKNKNIVVVQTGSGNAITFFAANSNKPAFSIYLPNGAIGTQIALTATQRQLFAAAFTNDTVYFTAYPLTPSSVWTQENVIGNEIQGVALSHGQSF